MNYPEFLVDKRVVQRNIAKGVVDAKEYAKLLTNLPDMQGNADFTASERAPERDRAAE